MACETFCLEDDDALSDATAALHGESNLDATKVRLVPYEEEEYDLTKGIQRVRKHFDSRLDKAIFIDFALNDVL